MGDTVENRGMKIRYHDVWAMGSIGGADIIATQTFAKYYIFSLLCAAQGSDSLKSTRS